MKSTIQRRALWILLPLSLAWSISVWAQTTSLETHQATYQKQIRPLLQKYCIDCHGPKKEKGELRLDVVSTNFKTAKPRELEIWDEVLSRISIGDMPPKKCPQPTPTEMASLLAWLNTGLEELAVDNVGTPVMRRLTHYEYSYTLQDLLGVKFDFTRKSKVEFASKSGLRNDGSALNMSSLLLNKRWELAKLALSKAVVAGPKPEVFRIRAEDDGKGEAPLFNPFRKDNKPHSLKNLLTQSTLVLPQQVFALDIDSQYQRGRFRARYEVEAYPGPNGLLPSVQVLVYASTDSARSRSSSRVIFEKKLPAGVSTFEVSAMLEECPQVLRPLGRRSTGLILRNITTDRNSGHVGVLGDSGLKIIAGAYDKKKPRKKKSKKNAKPPKFDPQKEPRIRVRLAEYEIPYFTQWPPKSHSAIFHQSSDQGDEVNAAQSIFARFAQRAWRRPCSDSEIETLVTLFQAVRPHQSSFEDAICEVLAMILISPNTMYLLEPHDKNPTRALTDFEFASRLSYFLWCSPPDDTLFRLAQEGTLRKPQVLATQVKRMLQDPRLERFINHFSEQWFGIDKIEHIQVDRGAHGNFTVALKQDMKRESQLFFGEILKQNLPCTTLLDADFTMANSRLVKYYGEKRRSKSIAPLHGARSLTFERVPLKANNRRNGGLLAHGSIQLIGSDGVESHPVKRGAWVLRTLFDDPPPEPPSEVPTVDKNDPEVEKLSIRQQLKLHNTRASCKACHAQIDPWGIPFEEYNAAGLWRDQVHKYTFTNVIDKKTGKTKKKRHRHRSQINAEAKLPDGKTIKGVEALAQYILTEQRERFERAVVQKILAYALGRSLGPGDRKQIDILHKAFVANELKLQPLILAVIQSESFNRK